MFYVLPFKFYVLPSTFYLLCFTFYLCPFTFYLLPFTFYHLPFTIYHLPFTVFDVHGSWLMAGKSLVSIAALLVDILDMGGGKGEEGQVITLVTLNLLGFGF